MPSLLTANAAPSAAVVAGAIKAGLEGSALAATTALNLSASVARDWFLTRLKWGLGVLGLASLLISTVVTFEPVHKSKGSPASPVTAVAAPNAIGDAQQILAGTKSAASRPKLKRMSLKVLAAENSLLLPDAKISVVFYGTKNVTADLATDAYGLAEIVLPQRPFEGMAVWVAATGRVPKSLTWRCEEEPWAQPQRQVVR